MFKQSRCIIRHFKHIIGIVFIIIFIVCLESHALTLTDNKGRHIAFSKPFTRIISLYGAHTENLYHLGLEDQIIGVSVNDMFPAKVSKKPSFSYHDDSEKFLAFMPDLVLIRPMIDNGYPQLMHRLEKSGITVVSLQPSSVNQMYDYWLKLGLLTGKDKQARKMIQDFKEKTDAIKARTYKIPVKKRVYF